MSSKDSESKLTDHLYQRTVPDSRPLNTNHLNRLPNIDSNGSDYPWESYPTVRTKIESGDKSYASSLLDPNCIRVKTKHERQVSPVPLKYVGRTITWPEKIVSRSMEELSRNGSL
jgi:hypothetical protein